MDRLESLKLLQKVDLALDSRAARLKAIEAQLAEPEALKKARQAQEEAEKRLAELRHRLREGEWELRNITERLGAAEKALYGGGIASPRELADKQMEAQSLGRRKSEIEDQVLEAMAEVEEAEDLLRIEANELEALEASRREEERNLQGEKAQLLEEMKGLNGDREQVLPLISRADLQVYTELRARKAGRALAALKDGICQGCMVSLPVHLARRVRESKELVFCNSCGRILYAQ